MRHEQRVTKSSHMMARDRVWCHDAGATKPTVDVGQASKGGIDLEKDAFRAELGETR